MWVIALVGGSPGEPVSVGEGGAVKKVIGGLVALCAVAVAGFGIWALAQPSRSYHVTECGIGAGGPYARVSVTNRTAGLGRKQAQVEVRFRYDGKLYGYGNRTVKLAPFGSTTTTLIPLGGRNNEVAPVDPDKLACTFIPSIGD